MKRRLVLLLAMLALPACSTSPYLHPESESGQPRSIDRTCPGAQQALQYFNADHSESLLVYVALPIGSQSEGTELRLFTWRYGKPGAKPARISADSPDVDLVLPSGERRTVRASLLENGFQSNDPRITNRSRGTKLYDGNLDEFILLLPVIRMNGEALDIRPIHFHKTQSRYASVFNC
ncbi:hypothetical protein A6723_003900 [Pseudomonas sp. AU11447]|uniref:hypothetical protein n=1 Tax=unclassified Pseudomonas TaxID=196821 RepID=UPI0006D47547|nr:MULTISPECIES: hypothetical protein [unclassified Pseudomonas]OBY92712.1 hypothetical protein A6723_003900 [Pseudomonas sp. AU11447]